ncbi:hypothetical protein MKUB_45910 [Mycobacterium kubicae]|uniref:Uncharacterized protein n=1 Tax=Mycobacterium kubicae TaxID=120959 RepID=A0AAX1J5Y9_9MYCO|nr:hypothetical protein [Mycobacterium kubicae]MCV7097368.1 hypothetical protein [Mycobacterium kubicae]ORW00431.1 hypothetical protein AWC13_09165 [Mycobacterium kubicae]QNI13357.1 hypothetical protein GAN18_21220 [Mycobacterium kubicae]QPI36879.1 hypothetical protein I2456_20890 [Mycobacterium kubicae]GFG67101.1 hypothetical protein MKUB_45910 [Mycobacterium kubicae]
MDHNGDVYTLLAMTPAGESVLVEDHDRISLIRFTTRGRQREDATPDDVDVAVRRHGWYPVDRRFADWDALDRYRVQAAEQTLRRFPDTDVANYDRRAVEVILKQVARAGPARRLVAEKLLTDLLVRCRLVNQDDELRARIGDQLESLRASSPAPDSSVIPPDKERAQLARLDLSFGLDAA